MKAALRDLNRYRLQLARIIVWIAKALGSRPRLNLCAFSPSIRWKQVAPPMDY
jgi:hypothetical protein